MKKAAALTQQPDIPLTPRYTQLWSDFNHDFNGIRRQKGIEGSIDGHPRLFMTPGDAIRFNVLSKRWNKWLGILAMEVIIDVKALAFLAATNQASIETRLGMAWKMLFAIGTVIALQKLEVSVLLGQAVRDLASYGTIGRAMTAVLWVGFVTIATYMLLIHLWRINASERRACVDLALLRRKLALQPVHA